jgi:hypothetical protein
MARTRPPLDLSASGSTSSRAVAEAAPVDDDFQEKALGRTRLGNSQLCAETVFLGVTFDELVRSTKVGQSVHPAPPQAVH